jgi:hypothetical protein
MIPPLFFPPPAPAAIIGLLTVICTDRGVIQTRVANLNAVKIENPRHSPKPDTP